MEEAIEVRAIQAADNVHIAKIIRNSLEEFKANKPGTVYYDDTTDHLFEVFRQERCSYFIIHQKTNILGGAGVFPTSGLPADTCELVKLYITASARGKGIGKLLVQKCMEAAIAFGYKKIYLESMPELTIAIPMYEKMGFKFISRPMGNSGHKSCDVWMIKDLK